MRQTTVTDRVDKEEPNSAQVTRVLVVEDHSIVREGVCLLLQTEPSIQVIGRVGTGEDAISFVRRNKPDLVVMDLGLPGMNGLEATRIIKAENPEVRVLILTMYADDQYILGTLNAGVSGYLLKQSAVNDLIPAVRAIASGCVFLQPTATQAVIGLLCTGRDRSQHEPSQHNDTLSEREKEVIKLVGKGLSSKEIGNSLRLSPTTVDNYRSRIIDKLQAKNAFEAYAVALKKGIIEP